MITCDITTSFDSRAKDILSVKYGGEILHAYIDGSVLHPNIPYRSPLQNRHDYRHDSGALNDQ